MNPLSMAVASAPHIKQDPSHQKGIRSTSFDDVYFNGTQALENACYDYLDGNDLISRWQEAEGQESFVVAETGFGTGLNFLLLWRLWQKQESRPKHLHFISCELHPIAPDALAKIHSKFPELKAQSEVLLAHYPSLRLGFHRIKVSDSVSLTLMWGDATACFRQCLTKIDAWFLDGFDPKKNPQMWSTELFQQISQLSKTNATVSTYTAASQVRRSLEAEGFAVKKRKGFGKKREMITAVKTSNSIETKPKQNWSPIKPATPHQELVVLGGGIAGLSVTRACAMAGLSVTLIDQTAPMQGASGNPAGMVMPYLTAQPSPEALFYWRAFEFAIDAYSSKADQGYYRPIGVEEWCLDEKKQQWAETIFGAHQWPADLIQNRSNSVSYPRAGSIDTQGLKSHWLSFAQQVMMANVTEVIREEGRWLLLDSEKNTVKSCDVLIVTAGINCLKFKPFEHLPLVPKHGQVSVIQCDKDLPFKGIQKHQGYAIPLSDKQCLLGATFDHLKESDWFKTPVLQKEHLSRNLDKWCDFKTWRWPTHQLIKGKAGIRTTTPDHLPVCGTVVDAARFKHEYADLHHGRHWQNYPEAETLRNLYVMTGLGARGFTSAPLLGQLLADMILGRPLPLELDLCKMLHPNRFLYKQLKKKRP